MNKLTTHSLYIYFGIFASLFVSLCEAYEETTNPYTRVSPTGSIYDSRTYMYDPIRKRVKLKPEFQGMTTKERRAVIQKNIGNKVWYPGNAKINLGAGRWVTPFQLSKIRQLESKISQQKANFATLRISSGETKQSNGETKRSSYASYLQSNSLRNLITGATVSIETPEASGSGVITAIGRQKFVLTANHVIEGASYAHLTSLKDKSYGTVNRTVGWHKIYDIAAIPLPRTLWHLPIVPLFNGQPTLGQPVYLSGFPKGSYRLTTGRVAGYQNGGTQLLHTAYSEGGASGGMLLTPNGYLCGIHSGVYLPSSSLSGYRFATPSSVIIQLVRIYGR